VNGSVVKRARASLLLSSEGGLGIQQTSSGIDIAVRDGSDQGRQRIRH
jgi:hypothetical protein